MYFFQTPWIPELLTGSNDNFAFNEIIKLAFSTNESKEALEVYKYYYSQPGNLKCLIFLFYLKLLN